MKRIGKIPDILLVSVFYILFLLNVTQVIFRYVFNASLVWSEELLRALLIWCTYLGTALCIRDDESIVIDIVSLIKDREKLVNGISFVQKVFTALIVSVFLVLSYNYLSSTITRNLTTPALRMPLWVPVSSLVVSSVLSLFYIGKQFYFEHFKSKK